MFSRFFPQANQWPVAEMRRSPAGSLVPTWEELTRRRLSLHQSIHSTLFPWPFRTRLVFIDSSPTTSTFSATCCTETQTGRGQNHVSCLVVTSRKQRKQNLKIKKRKISLTCSTKVRISTCFGNCCWFRLLLFQFTLRVISRSVNSLQNYQPWKQE